MKFKEFIQSEGLKKGLGVVSIIFAGVVGMANALAEQQKTKEFEQMKKDIADLQNK